MAGMVHEADYASWFTDCSRGACINAHVLQRKAWPQSERDTRVNIPWSFANQLKRLTTLFAVIVCLSGCMPTPHTDAVMDGNREMLLRVGDAARDSGEFVAAIPFYRQAHLLDNRDPTPLLRLAETLGVLGEYREAGDAWKRALAIDPLNFEARVGYGETLVALGQPLLALEQFRLAREHGSDADLFNGIGVTNDMLGNAEAAQTAYREGLSLDRNLKLLNNLGLSLALSGAHEEAITILVQANALPGAGLHHRANLALAHVLGGSSKRAQAVLVMEADERMIERMLEFFAVVAGLSDHKSRVAAMGVIGAVLNNVAIGEPQSRRQ